MYKYLYELNTRAVLSQAIRFRVVPVVFFQIESRIPDETKLTLLLFFPPKASTESNLKHVRINAYLRTPYILQYYIHIYYKKHKKKQIERLFGTDNHIVRIVDGVSNKNKRAFVNFRDAVRQQYQIPRPRNVGENRETIDDPRRTSENFGKTVKIYNAINARRSALKW